CLSNFNWKVSTKTKCIQNALRELISMLILPSEHEYKSYYESILCEGPIRSSFGFDVYSNQSQLEHAFYASLPGSHFGQKLKEFSFLRARGMSLILAAAPGELDEISRQHGWDKRNRRHCKQRSAGLILPYPYLLVIQI